jgi:hypothetical protein
LENHHINTLFSILAQERSNILAALPKDQQRLIRTRIIKGILNTDSECSAVSLGGGWLVVAALLNRLPLACCLLPAARSDLSL